jgi:hypothetical protein
VIIFQIYVDGIAFVPPECDPPVSAGVDRVAAFVAADRPRIRKKVDLSDLINSGALQVGMSLFPRRKKYSHQVATLLRDGQVEVNGEAFSRPSDAASRIVGKRTNGWWFFLTDQAFRRSLRSVRRDYVNAMAVDVEDDEPEDDGDDDENEG